MKSNNYYSLMTGDLVADWRRRSWPDYLSLTEKYYIRQAFEAIKK